MKHYNLQRVIVMDKAELKIKTENQTNVGYKSLTKGQLLIMKCTSDTPSTQILKEAKRSQISSAKSR